MIKKDPLPKGWTMTKLGELAITEKGKKPKRVSKEKTRECSIPYINIKAFEKKIIDEYTDGVGCVLCEDDDFLMVWDGSRSGYVGKAIKGALGSTLVRIKLPEVNQDLTYYFLKSKFIEINTRAKGVGIPHVDPNLLWNYDFPLAPLNEQKRILAKLEQLLTDLDKGIEYLETTKHQLKVYRQAVLKWAFEGKLTNKDVKEGNLPNGWGIKSLKDIVDKIADGPFGSNLKTADYVDNGIRVVRLENIGELVFNDEYKSFVTHEKYETIKRHSVTKGDIIFSSFISENIRAVILPDYIENAINKADCFLVRTSPLKANRKFLAYYFSSKAMHNQLVGQIHGATRPRINTTQLKETQIPVPQLEEQNKIVQEIESRLSVCDKIEETIASSLQQAEALRLSIIKKAFEGKLVPQDPNDEPAEKLLERIRAAKTKSRK